MASLAAASVYGLDVLERAIQDNDNNLTRFIVISLSKAKRGKENKTSIVFSTEDKPGSLYKVLDIFSLWDINMTRIESRPAKRKLGRYIFFVDIEGHAEDEDVKMPLRWSKEKHPFTSF